MNDLMRVHNPDIVFLTETHTSGKEANKIISNLKMIEIHRVEARGFSGGI